MPDISKISYKGTSYDIYDSTHYATYNAIGGVKPAQSNTTAITFAQSTVLPRSISTAVTVNEPSAVAGHYYIVETDVNGRLYVNVPWENTIPTITHQGHTGSWVTSGSSTGYKIHLELAASNADVYVPFFAAGTSGGLVKQPASGDTTKFLRGDNTWAAPADTNYTYALDDSVALGNGQVAGGYKIQLIGSNGGSSTDVTVPVYNNTNKGLVPATTASQISDGSYFLNADATWKPVNTAKLWFVPEFTTYAIPSTSPYVLENQLVSTASAKALGGYASGTTPEVGDSFITSAGYVGFWTQVGASTQSQKATICDRLDFMAYGNYMTLHGSWYDSSTSTLTLGAY